MSGQSSADQQLAKDRLGLPFDLISDAGFKFGDALGLPRFTVPGTGKEYLVRVTLVIRDGVVEEVLFPVFPTGDAADQVIRYLQTTL